MGMKKSFLFALRRSIPVMVGYCPVGIAYGILMSDAGYSVLMTAASSLFIYAGSLQFAMVPLMFDSDFFANGSPLRLVDFQRIS